MSLLKRPQPGNYNDYYQRYIDQVRSDDFIAELVENEQKVLAFFQKLPSDRWNFRYADGKWSVKEVWQHVIDTERILSYRALRIARHDKSPMPGFDQDAYVPYYALEKRSPESLLEEYSAVRKATTTLFKHLDPEAFRRSGTASENPFTPLALGFIIAGHELHHYKIIAERYL